MALTLQITDAQDGTGGTATIAGSDVGTTNTLYRASFSGVAGPLTWAMVGSRTGDGTITIAQATGYYLWHLTGTVSAATAFAGYFRPLTDLDEQSENEQILDAVVQKIRTLNLEDVDSASVDFKWMPRKVDSSVDPLPQVQVIPINGETFPGTLTGRDDVGYPVMVVLIDSQDKDFKKNKRRNLMWRSLILKAFRFQHLTGPTEAYNCIPEQQTIIDPANFKDGNLFVSFIALRFISRERRGV
jgi:hypothetical protein